MDNRIFEEQYGGKKTTKPDSGPFLYRLLKTFEEHRLTKVAKLVVGNKLDVLEVGFNDGQFLRNNMLKWRTMAGVDIVPRLVADAKKREYPIPARFYLTDLGRQLTTIKPESFDLVVSIATVQLVYDLDLFFKNLNKVLRPNGQLIIEVPNSVVFWRRLQLFLGEFPKTSGYSNGWDGGTIHYFTKGNLTKYLEKYGFEVRGVVCSGILSEIRSLWPSFFGANLIFDCRKKYER